MMRRNKSQEVNEQIEYGIEKIKSDRQINIELKDFIYVYKAIEELRRFFHQRYHYPTLNDIYTYLGDREKGAYSVLNNLYLKILDKYLPKDIESKLEEEFRNPEYPYYCDLKREKKFKLSVAGNVEAPSYKLIQDMGYEIVKIKENWIASDHNSEFCADNPLELLGLVTLYRSKGDDWKVSDKTIEEFINLDNNE